jgi:hypothetical protein
LIVEIRCFLNERLNITRVYPCDNPIQNRRAIIVSVRYVLIQLLPLHGKLIKFVDEGANMLGRTLSTPDRHNDDGVAKEIFLSAK